MLALTLPGQIIEITESRFPQIHDLLPFNHSELHFSVNEDNITYLMYFYAF